MSHRPSLLNARRAWMAQRRYVALLDFDGNCFAIWSPFVYELEDRAASGRWGRFFGHTSEVGPLAAGVDLVKALDRVGWRALFGVVDPAGVEQVGGLRRWGCASTCRSSPEWTYVYRHGGLRSAEAKRQHYWEAMGVTPGVWVVCR